MHRLRPCFGLVLALAATATAQAQAVGGTVEGEASEYGNTGIYIAFVVDPEGNHIELIQPARR